MTTRAWIVVWVALLAAVAVWLDARYLLALAAGWTIVLLFAGAFWLLRTLAR